jgi:3' exoribonuclease, RNase T-like
MTMNSTVNKRATTSSPPPDVGNVMVDVETLGKRAGCAILSIGAVRFDPAQDPGSAMKTAHLQGKSQFYLAINNLDSSNRGFSADPDTMRWWKKQSIWPDLSMAIMSSDVTVVQAAKRFADFLDKSHNGGGVKLWANSPSFDIAILRAMCKVVDVQLPIDYRQEMDYRTIMELAYPHREDRPGRPAELNQLPLHHALGDAVTQANDLIKASERLGIAAAKVNDSRQMDLSMVQRDEGRTPGCHMMLEVKTLGKSTGSALLSIGAVVFDPTGRKSIENDKDNQFHVVLNSFDMGNYGFGSDPETVRWWKSQPIWPQLSKDTVQMGVPLTRALKLLNDFIERKSPDKVWANSPAFDIEMLREAYTAVRTPFPITYRQEMDYRTVMDLVYPQRDMRPTNPNTGFMLHHAMGDALGQSKTLVSTLNRLNLDRDALAMPRQVDSPAPAPQETRRRSAKP